MSVKGTIHVLSDADYRNQMKRLGVKIPNLTIEDAMNWWEKKEKREKGTSSWMKSGALLFTFFLFFAAFACGVKLYLWFWLVTQLAT